MGGFHCLSYLFTGTPSSSDSIKHCVNKKLCGRIYEDGKFRHQLGLMSELFSKEQLDTLLSRVITPLHFRFIAELLECRIGIYENGTLIKYGDWSADDGTLTILLSKVDDDKYLPVLKM